MAQAFAPVDGDAVDPKEFEAVYPDTKPEEVMELRFGKALEQERGL